jgi:hypothetical protein
MISKFFVASIRQDDIILSLDWLGENNPKINWQSQTVEFRDLKKNPRQTMDNFFRRIQHMATKSTLSHPQRINQEQEGKLVKKPKTLKELVPQYLLKFKTVFLQGKQAWKTLPMSRPFDHVIKLTEGFILRNTKIYSLNPQEMKLMEQFMAENLANGFIVPSESPQASPFFFVGKKEVGELQPCQDYWYLNQWTIKNSHTLLLITDLLDSIGDAKIFTKLDIRWGYNNILIKSVLHNVHRRREIMVMEQLVENGLFLKPAFSQKQIKYLRFIISEGSIKMDPRKMEGITNWETPTMVKEVKSFLGFINYYW